MINVVRLWNTVQQLAKNVTSGYQTQEEFNNDLADVQSALITMLAPFYSVNQSVKDLLNPFVISVTGTTSSGSIAYPSGYFRVLALRLNASPSYPIATNEKDIIMTSPIRMASTVKNLYYHSQESTGIKTLPTSALPYVLDYLKYPTTATIVLTPVSDANNDYLVPTVGVNLEWNEDAFNFILYMMLERLGLEMKENLILSWSNIGIQKETANI